MCIDVLYVFKSRSSNYVNHYMHVHVLLSCVLYTHKNGNFESDYVPVMHELYLLFYKINFMSVSFYYCILLLFVII